MKFFKTMRQLLAAVAALGMFTAVPAVVYADEAVAFSRMRVSVPCRAARHNNQAKITYKNSPRYAKAKIACRLWPDQYTGWIKNGTSYSGGCPLGVNDVPSGNPVSLEVGNP